jgi:YegS/Rv2252/BmrU family lipid kinase
MMENTTDKILFVVNKNSGNSDKEGLLTLIREKCRDRKHRVYQFEKGHTKENLSRAIADFGPAFIAACGGDGTVALAGEFCLNSDLKLGIIPMGSSNALSKNLGIPADIGQAMDIVLKGYSRTIDTLKVDDHHCFHLCDIGFNAELVKKFNKSKIRGMVGYTWYFFKTLLSFDFFNYNLTCGRGGYTGKAFSVTITNTRMYGTKAEINPLADMDDGVFEICIVKKFPAYMFVPLAYMLFQRELPKSRYTQYIHCREAAYELAGNEEIQIDGEPVKLPRRFMIRQLPHSLKVIVKD